MLKLQVIGAGAAGNKAAIALIEKGFTADSVTLINSTSKDIPEKYKDNSIIFGTSSMSLGGCGKERDAGKNLFIRDLKSGNIRIDDIIDTETKVVIIVSSTEGGSGSAVTPILARYINDVLNIRVITVLFFGFNTDVRGMQNSIEICQEIDDTYGVIGISNAKFLEPANGNRIKAERMANEEFCNIVRILSGHDLADGDQNIDDTDLFKLVTTPGYMCIEHTDLRNVKNIDMFNKAVGNAIDESKLVDSEAKTAKRIGVVFDIPESMADSVDYDATVIRQRYGVPYEYFSHIQNESSIGNITWIVSGMNLPIQELKEIFENYKRASAQVSKDKDSFFDTIAVFSGNKEDSMFNSLNRGNHHNRDTAKSNFFADFDDD